MNQLLPTINILAILFCFLSFLLQLAVWSAVQDDITRLLRSVCKCSASNLLRSNAQKFAVFLATRRANFWYLMIDTVGKKVAPPSLVLAFLMLGFDFSGKDLKTYFDEAHPNLYALVFIQILFLISITYIGLSLRHFAKDFSVSSATPDVNYGPSDSSK